MENASEEAHSNKNSRSISSEESAELSASTFGLPHHSREDVQAKRNTHKLQKCDKMYITGDNLWRLLHSKMLSIFGST